MPPAEDGRAIAADGVPVTVDDADGRANEIGGRSGRESRLDLVLAEELAVDREFALWFVGEAVTWREGCRPAFPGHPLLGAEVRLNVYEDSPPVPSDAHGETDIALKLMWEGRRPLSVVIEDKVWSPFQPRQPERCAKRAEVHEGVAVLVAPEGYLRSHQAKAEIFHGRVSVERIIARLRAHEAHEASDSTSERRREWRAQLLSELVLKPPPTPPDPATVSFTEFCVGWLEQHKTGAIPNRAALRNKGQGWLWFEVPRGLGYKATGWASKARAGVDLYVKDHGFKGTAEELDEILKEVGMPKGFYQTVDTAKNLVLRYECAKVDPSLGAPEPGSQRDQDILDALEACQRAVRWLRDHEERLSARSSGEG